jgi:hypothetical protein
MRPPHSDTHRSTLSRVAMTSAVSSISAMALALIAIAVVALPGLLRLIGIVLLDLMTYGDGTEFQAEYAQLGADYGWVLPVLTGTAWIGLGLGVANLVLTTVALVACRGRDRYLWIAMTLGAATGGGALAYLVVT